VDICPTTAFGGSLNLIILPPLNTIRSSFLSWARVGDGAQKVDTKFASVGVYVLVLAKVEWSLGPERFLIITMIITERGRSQLNEAINSCMTSMTARQIWVQIVVFYGVF